MPSSVTSACPGCMRSSRNRRSSTGSLRSAATRERLIASLDSRASSGAYSRQRLMFSRTFRDTSASGRSAFSRRVASTLSRAARSKSDMRRWRNASKGYSWPGVSKPRPMLFLRGGMASMRLITSRTSCQ